jgi:hypothetical protein
MTTFETVKQQTDEQFRRDVGISLDHFLAVRDLVRAYLRNEQYWQPLRKRGKKSRLSLEDKLVLTFYYLRHYQTFDQLGKLFGITEAYACKLYHRHLDILVKVLRLPGRKALLDANLQAIIIDVTEQPIERPTRKQRDYYSGKKKRHTLKAQLVICLCTLQILSVICGKGRAHDFTLFKQSNLRILNEILKYVDLGYQGIQKLVANSKLPFKTSKNKPLTPEQKQYNRLLAKLRIKIEHVNRRCKIFRIVKETYRGKHKHYRKTWAVVAALVNLRYVAS